MDEHARPGRDRVVVELERVDAVLERVLHADGPPGQLAGLAGRDEAAAEPVGERPAEDEASRLRARARGRAGAARRTRRGASTASRSASGSASSGMMSLKTIPGRGKSGTSRIRASEVRDVAHGARQARAARARTGAGRARARAPRASRDRRDRPGGAPGCGSGAPARRASSSSDGLVGRTPVRQLRRFRGAIPYRESRAQAAATSASVSG